MKLSIYRVSMAAIAAGLVTIGTAGNAQDAVDSTARSQVMDEIVVTAEKHVTSVQKVASSIVAFNADALSQLGVKDVTSLQGFAPSLSFQNSATGSADASLSMRGASQQDNFPPADPAVGIYADGVYIPRQIGNLFDFVDVERIEVLAGPQGTLYGRNTTGGLVNVITKRPVFSRVEGSVKGALFTYTDGPNSGDVSYATTGILNVPLASNIAFRGSVRYVDDIGYGRTVHGDGVSQKDGDGKNLSWRAALAFDPTDAIKLTFTADGFNNKNHNRPAELRATYPIGFLGNLDLTSPYLANGIDWTEFSNPIEASKYFSSGHAGVRPAPFQHVKGYGFNFTPEIQLTDNLAFKTILGYRRTDQIYGFDCDHTPVAICEAAANMSFKNYSAEAQFTYTPSDALTLILGGYYFHERDFLDRTSLVFGLFGPVASPPATAINDLSTTVYATYLHGEYALGGGVSFFGGIRYNHEKKSNSVIIVGTNGAPNSNLTGDFTYSVPTWEVGAKYQVSPDAMLFAKWAHSYRSGGINPIFVDVDPGTGVVTPKPFNKETVDSYELGIKSTFWDRRARVNLTGYYSKAKGFQRISQQFSVVTSNFAQAVQNLDYLKSYGFELEALLNPVDPLTLRMTAGLVKSDQRGIITDIDPATFAPVPIQVHGLNPPNTPTWTLSGAISYKLGGEKGKFGSWTSILNANYVSEVFTEVENNIQTKSSARTLFDLRLDGTSVGADAIDVSFYVKNLFNKKYYEFGQNIVFLGYGYNYVGAPRSAGIEVSYRF